MSFWGRRPQRWDTLLILARQGTHDTPWLSTGDINLNHLVKMVSARLLSLLGSYYFSIPYAILWKWVTKSNPWSRRRGIKLHFLHLFIWNSYVREVDPSPPFSHFSVSAHGYIFCLCVCVRIKYCSYLFCGSDCSSFGPWESCPCFLSLALLPSWHYNILRCPLGFSAPALESAVSPRSPVTLIGEWYLESTLECLWLV